MRAKAFRMLVMYVSGEEVRAGVFDNKIEVFDQNLLVGEQPLPHMCTNLLASLDEEGINISKLQAVCVPGFSEKETAGRVEKETGEEAIVCGMDMARYISRRLNIQACFAVPGSLSITGSEQPIYPGDPYLLYLAEQALFMLMNDQ
ncbi:hypothetical protein F9802_01355 [Bacillus aerolatus]|uniref:Uncharacterized protein n=1 Tax=Bacillus aerolatus TaxID=2653354 RepID=A0A6I1FQ56_9BACI|nr:hypothetical protein [Bacillus aerolatus]KAB7708822.1 hypothetical protein F9802_01355 [Bacillus aerolatus]